MYCFNIFSHNNAQSLTVIIFMLLQTAVPPKGMIKFTEDSLLRHAQFICDQVSSFDDSAEAEDALLITSSCMRSLANLAGVTLGKRAAIRRAHRREQKVKQPAWTKATTTTLVNNMFETIFTDQLAKRDDKITMVYLVIISYFYSRDDRREDQSLLFFFY